MQVAVSSSGLVQSIAIRVPLGQIVHMEASNQGSGSTTADALVGVDEIVRLSFSNYGRRSPSVQPPSGQVAQPSQHLLELVGALNMWDAASVLFAANSAYASDRAAETDVQTALVAANTFYAQTTLTFDFTGGATQRADQIVAKERPQALLLGSYAPASRTCWFLLDSKARQLSSLVAGAPSRVGTFFGSVRIPSGSSCTIASAAGVAN